MVQKVKVGWFARVIDRRWAPSPWGIIVKIVPHHDCEPAIEVEFQQSYVRGLWLSQFEVTEHIGPADCAF